MSISSVRVDQIRPGMFKSLTALKFFRASRARSTCFLKDESEGIIEVLVGEMGISTKDEEVGLK